MAELASLRTHSPDLGSNLAQAALTDIVDDSHAFFDDVCLSPLESLQHFCHSSQSFQRLAYSQGIAAAAAAASCCYQDCVEVLLPLAQQLLRDPEAEIRATVVKQLAGLGTALYEKDAETSLRDIEATLLVCAQQCALDDEDEVSQAGILAFQQLVQLLPTARATAASKRAVDRLESQGSDDGTLAAVRLLAHTVAFWTPEALKRHVPRYTGRWASHRDFAVREAAATCMSLVVPAMPLRLCHQVLLPAFYQLSRDQNWRVRRACALDLPRLAAALQERPADASTPTATGCSSSSSSNHWQQEVEADQPLGCCSSRPSSCLAAMQRFAGDLTGSQLAANVAAASGPQRNHSYPSLANRSPATTAQIMTKHPMHSSLIIDGLLSGSSSCNSLPGSPSGSSEGPSLAADSQDEVCSSVHTLRQQPSPARSVSDCEAQHEQQHEQPACSLEQQAALLHDAWCALRQCMELLTADSSHWVKVAALSGLGPFQLQLPPCQLGQLLLGRFTSMAGSTVVIYEVSVALACAQAFGQLAVLLGPDRWADMRDAWHALQASRDPAVLCEVVNCLPQLMAALGPVLTHREMCPALAGLLQSHLTWVGGQLVQVMADLFTHLPPTGHELLLKTLPQLATSSGDRSRSWRVRRDLALQLGRLAVAAGPEGIENSIWPTAMSLCCDPIAAVRTAAASQIGPILAALPPHMLQSIHGDAADNCAACSDEGMACHPGGHAAAAQAYAVAAVAAASAAAEAAAAAARNGSQADSHSQDSSLGGAAGETDGPAAAVSTSSQHGASRLSSKGRSGSFSVRFALDGDAPSSNPSASSSSHSHSRSCGVLDSHSRPGGVLSGLVAAADQQHGGAQQHSGSMDFDELALPSALAPAPAGCFSAHSSDWSDDEDAVDGNVSSGLSSSSSHSSRSAGSHHSSSSSDNGGGSDSDSDSDEDAADGAAGVCWRDADSSGREGMPAPEPAPAAPTVAAEAAAAESPSVTAAAAPARPLYAMHPAMMPVGALTAASAASGSRPVPVTKQRALPNRARSTGDLLRLQSTVSASDSEESTLGAPHRGDVAGRFRAQHRGRRLPDSLPSGLLASSSDDDFGRHSSAGDWAGGLPQPAHAAPHQYLPVLVQYFGCSSSHQQRQLFVPLALGLLASCHKCLSCSQQAVLLDRLEALAHDSVPGVRYAVATALADVRVQAAALTGQQPHLGGAAAGGVQTEQQHDSQQQAAEPEASAATQQPAGNAPADDAEAAAGGLEAAASAGVRQPEQQQQEEVPALQEQQHREDVQPAEEPAAVQPTQMVGHVPKGAHPLLGYQAYVQQLSRTSSRGGAAASTPSSSSSNAQPASPANSSRSPAPAAAAAASGRTTSCSALPPRSGLSPAVGKQLSMQHSSSRRQQQPAGVSAAAEAPVKARRGGQQATGVAGAAQAGVAVADATAAAGAGGGQQAPEAAEWLLKLSNCQQLERLMHVVALTTGPLH